MISFKTLKNIGSILSKVLLSFVFLVIFSHTSFSSDIPEWNGVYIKYNNGEYKTLKMFKEYRIHENRRVISYSTSDFNLIPAHDFKGILIKGNENLIKYSIKQARRLEKFSLGGLFGKSEKIDYYDYFNIIDNKSFLRVLREKQETYDSKYFEPTSEASSFFGKSEKGYFVFISVGEKQNHKMYIFGITGAAQTDLDKASHTVKNSQNKGDTNNNSVDTENESHRNPIRADAQLSSKMCPPGYWFDIANKVCIVDDKK